MSLQSVCPWWNRKVPFEYADRARCPHCNRRVMVRGYRIRFHRLPARVS